MYSLLKKYICPQHFTIFLAAVNPLLGETEFFRLKFLAKKGLLAYNVLTFNVF